MNPLLYLDTARLGIMTPAAEQAGHAFLQLAGQEGASPLAEMLLHEGYLSWPQEACERFPGLSCWGGLEALRTSLRHKALAPAGCPVLLATRSSHLMHLAARLLVSRCRRILTTDLEWPAYAAILARECHRRGRLLIQVPLRQRILADQCQADQVAEFVAIEAARHGCDGAFLTAVTYEGFRLPVERLTSLLPEAKRSPFVVLDGAQALGHVNVDLRNTACDLYLAGCHKWLRAYQLLGIGICPRPSSQEVIAALVENLLAGGEVDDPLLSLVDSWRRGQNPRFTETVALSPLFTAAAAVGNQEFSAERFVRLRETAEELERVGTEAGWKPILPHDSLRSGIVLLAGTRVEAADELRRQFYGSGIALTAYEGGILRVAAPPSGIGPDGMEQFRRALMRCA